MVATPNIRCDRYTFQGQERDDEVKGAGNSYSYTFRFYDSRLGRFLSIDPLIASYPELSPYSFAENKAIKYVELEGGETDDDKLSYSLGKAIPYARLTYLSEEYEESKANSQRLEEKAEHVSQMARTAQLKVNNNPRDLEAQQKLIEVTNTQNKTNDMLEKANRNEQVAGEILMTFVGNTDLDAKTTYEARISEVALGAEAVSVGTGKVTIDVPMHSGRWEAGTSVVTKGVDAGVGTAGFMAGGGPGTVSLYDKVNPSLTNEIESAEMTLTSTGGGAFGMGYESVGISGYEGVYGETSRLSTISTVFDMEFDKFVGGVGWSASVTSSVFSGNAYSTSTIDSTSNAHSEILFGDEFKDHLKEKGHYNADSISKYNTK